MFARADFPRFLSPEALDDLDEDDPRAVHSRKDLKRLNRIMGASGILANALTRYADHPKRIIEFGAGDGSLMLRLARRLAPRWPDVHVVLLDRQNVVDQKTRDALADIGWTTEILHADLESWIAQDEMQHVDISLANLFIHHFDAGTIRRLFEVLATRSNMFVACEPRRARLPLIGSRLVGMIGANEVTRSDAVLSVRAGFRGEELSSLWPASASEWTLTEHRAGLFSHVFVARRCG